MISIEVPEQFRQGNFNELLDSLQSLSGEGYDCVFESKIVISEFHGAGWKIRHVIDVNNDTRDWFIEFEHEPLATAFVLRWLQ